MILLVFTTTPRSADVKAEYDEINAATQATARETPGFISWRESVGPDGETVGILEFEDEDALIKWRDNPVHANANKRGREAVYGSYSVRICNVMRQSDFTYDGS
jgi:heme-degrading monooxygenase HmoA